MLTYTIPEELEMPLYQYIYTCIRDDIEKGELKAHEKLPSKRNLAKQLGVSLITVENAYSQLSIEGYITSIQKKGYFVNKITLYKRQETSNQFKLEEKRCDEYELDLTSNKINVDYFPFSLWSKLTREVLTNEKEDVLKPSPYNGTIQLRKAICEHLKQFQNLNVQPFQIVVGAGSEYLYSLLVQFFGLDKHYALENPTHKAINQIYKSNNVKYSYIDLDEYGIDVNKLAESAANFVHVSDNHHYPTGITMPYFRRVQLLKWAKENDGYIIEDDYDSEFRLKGKPVQPLFALDNAERVVYINTFSLTLASSFRMAYMVLPAHLASLYAQKMDFYHCTIPVLDQLTLANFIKMGHFERHINRLRKRYKDLKDHFVSSFKKIDWADKIRLKQADAGLHLLVEYDYQIDDEIVEKLAQEIGLKVYTVSHFHFDEVNSHTLVISYTSLDEVQCEKALTYLKELFSKVQQLAQLNEYLKPFALKASSIKQVLNTSKEDDFRLNTIFDNKYVLRINDTKMIDEKRLAAIARVIANYKQLQVAVPAFIKTVNNTYSYVLEDKIYYVTEYLAGTTLAAYYDDNKNEEEYERIYKQCLTMLGLYASKFSNQKLLSTYSMYSLINLSPFDKEVDEKQENCDLLVNKLNEIGEDSLALKVVKYNEFNRAQIINKYQKLPACNYQGDLNATNIIVEDEQFKGLIDFNLAGKDFNINYFLNETDSFDINLILKEKPAKAFMFNRLKQEEKLAYIFQNYKLNELEQQLMPYYANLISLFYYPSVMDLIYYLKTEKEKICAYIDYVVSKDVI